MLRYIADLRVLLWMTVSTALFFYQWHLGEVVWYLYIPYLYFAVTYSVFAHNHNHLPMWKNKILNVITDVWLTVFYGFPVFAWIPTHNKNHHKHNNKEPDYTKTYMMSEKNNLWTLFTYPTLSSRTQLPAVWAYYKSLWPKNKERFFICTLQGVALLAWVITAFVINWKLALIFVVIPQQVSTNVVLLFNYVQHVHADEYSEVNHSRNIYGWPTNFLLFNNGLHSVHHDQPGMHWSQARAAHNKVKHEIDPRLEEYSFWGYMIRQYLVAPFYPKIGTKSMRLARIEAEEAEKAKAAAAVRTPERVAVPA